MARRCSRSTARPTRSTLACASSPTTMRWKHSPASWAARPPADANTTDVLIESALWDELNIAQTGRKLGINSDARYRFERGVDYAFMLPGLELATQMVLDLCGGEPSEIVVAGDPTPKEKIIDFPLSELPRLAGLKLSLNEVRRVLEKLGFFAAGQGERVKVAAPSWRPDVHGRADIVEELVR